jgi:hypothetical protein
MYSASGRPRLASLGVGIAVYAAGVAIALGVVALAGFPTGVSLLRQLAPPNDAFSAANTKQKAPGPQATATHAQSFNAKQ